MVYTVRDGQSGGSPHRYGDQGAIALQLQGRRFSFAVARFWDRYPLFFVGFHFYLGILAALSGSYLSWLLLLPISIFPLIRQGEKVRLSAGCAVVLAGLFWAPHPIPESHVGQRWEGEACIRIKEMAPSRSLFHTGFVAQGVLAYFEAGEEVVQDVPVTLHLPATAKNLDAGHCYCVHGELRGTSRGYRWKAGRYAAWKPVDTGCWWMRWRHKARSGIGDLLAQRCGKGQASSLLTALVLGQLSDISSLLDFGRLGLQHVMAVSGFHFSLVAILLTLTLGRLIPGWRGVVVVGLLLSAYLWLVGPSAPALRAWVMAILAVTSQPLSRCYKGLNALGCALLVVLLLDPRSALSLGFSLSFVATGSILLFCGPIERSLCLLLPKRPVEEALAFSMLEQHVWLLLAFCRKLWALSLSVHLALLPLLLFYFHRFPLLGLLYNLFVPAVAALAILSTWLGVGISLLSPLLGWPLLKLAQSCAELLLNAVHYPPSAWEVTIRVPSFPAALVMAWLGGVLLFGIQLSERRDLRWPLRFSIFPKKWSMSRYSSA